ncbi:MAG TPA: hypothetical protein VEU33_42130 [Archangium sp.]|nr:hypothetical protein [Archangium sp.]
MFRPTPRSALRSGLKCLSLLALAWVAPASAQTFNSGTFDNFAAPTEPTFPSAGLQTWLANNYPVPGSRPHDAAHGDQYFATTFNGLTRSGSICGATLRMTVRNGHFNDSIGLWFVDPNGAHVANGWSSALTNLGANVGVTQTISLNLAALPGAVNLLPTLNAQGFLDLIVQDDTAVDAATLVITPCRFDAFMRDQASDHGVEPGTGPVWMSPDIRICNAQGCAGHQNPEFGQPNFVYVTLRNHGPNAVPPQNALGTLQVFYTASGGAAQWPADWTLINTVPNVALTPFQVLEVEVPWNNVPNPGHYCLLARWVAPTGDPMTFAETTNTLLNTERNNNLAWKNVNVVNLNPAQPSQSFDFRVRNLEKLAVPAHLEIRIPRTGPSFIERGRLLLKLDPRLWAAWSRQGEGFVIEGEGLVRIIDPLGAKLMNLKLEADAAQLVNLTFAADARDQVEQFEVQLVQHSATAAGEVAEVGGVGYQITVGPGK